VAGHYAREVIVRGITLGKWSCGGYVWVGARRRRNPRHRVTQDPTSQHGGDRAAAAGSFVIRAPFVIEKPPCGGGFLLPVTMNGGARAAPY